MNKFLVRAAICIGLITAGFSLANPAHASQVPGLPDCGGNAAGTGNNPTVPWTCGNVKQIAGIPGVTVGILNVRRTPSMTATVAAQVTLPAPQAFDVPVAIFWHIGKSSGPLTAVGSAVIPAGATSVIVSTGRSDICDGQVDVQVNRPAGFTGKSDLYRLHGPWITVASCVEVPGTTTVPTTVVGTTTPTTAPPPGVSVPTSTPGVPTTSSALPVVVQTLPATGPHDTLGFIGVALIAFSVGGILVLTVMIARKLAL